RSFGARDAGGGEDERANQQSIHGLLHQLRTTYAKPRAARPGTDTLPEEADTAPFSPSERRVAGEPAASTVKPPAAALPKLATKSMRSPFCPVRTRASTPAPAPASVGRFASALKSAA